MATNSCDHVRYVHTCYYWLWQVLYMQSQLHKNWKLQVIFVCTLVGLSLSYKCTNSSLVASKPFPMSNCVGGRVTVPLIRQVSRNRLILYIIKGGWQGTHIQKWQHTNLPHMDVRHRQEYQTPDPLHHCNASALAGSISFTFVVTVLWHTYPLLLRHSWAVRISPLSPPSLLLCVQLDGYLPKCITVF